MSARQRMLLRSYSGSPSHARSATITSGAAPGVAAPLTTVGLRPPSVSGGPPPSRSEGCQPPRHSHLDCRCVLILIVAGHVRLVRGCGDYLGYVKSVLLTTTFRYGPGILEPSTDFVQRNPEQTKRTLRSRSAVPDYGITVVAEKSPELGVATALEDIRCRTGSDGGSDDDYGRVSVFALGRYRRSQSVVKGRVEFSTIHRAKGREADFVLVLDLKNDHYGLPSQIDDDPLLDLVLPPLHSTAFPHAEERRLFYVAVTRARCGVYLITDGAQPSSFVEELLRDHPAIPRVGSGALALAHDAPICARCGGKLVESQSGKNLRCVNYPLCRHLAPRCRACDHGHVVVAAGRAVCTNDSCVSLARACPRCGFGVLTRRSGPRGSFLGCSEYRAEPPCEYTETSTR